MKTIFLIISLLAITSNNVFGASNSESDDLNKNIILPDTKVDKKDGIVTITTSAPDKPLIKTTIDSTQDTKNNITNKKVVKTASEESETDAKVCQEQGNIVINYNIINND
jgi:hypothetical protein